jgi:transketolase
MKILLLFITLSALTGCVSDQDKPKVYRTKIEFYKPEKLKVLYSMPEEEDLPEECYKINFPDIEFAEMELNTQMLRKMNEDTKKWIAIAWQKIKQGQAELARRKSRMAERKKQKQLIEEMKKELKQITARLEQKLQNKRLKNGY